MIAASAPMSWRERELFRPSILGVFVNPFFHARRALVQELKPLLQRFTGDVLDVGCGRKPYRSFVNCRSYTGLDIDTPVTRSLGLADVYYDGTKIPASDNSFDSVLCSQVLEHVFTPDAFLQELTRVLRPGGTLLVTIPFAWDEHEQPFDFARYSSFGIRHLLEQNGLEVVEVRKTATNARAIVQLASGWVYKVTRSRSRVCNAALQLGLIAPINIIGGICASVLPSNNDFYLDNIVWARKPG